jgi:hypothetical protein
MEINVLDHTTFNTSEVYWMEAIMEIAAAEQLPGFPMSEQQLYADPRWLAEYEAGFTVGQAIFRYKEDISLD